MAANIFSLLSRGGSNAETNFAKNFAQGMEVRQAMDANKEKKTLKDLYNKNTTTGEDGKMQFNRDSYLSDLSKVDAQKALEQKSAFDAQDIQAANVKLKSQLEQAKIMGSLAGSVTDQQTYDMAMNRAAQLGLDTKQMPTQYDPNLVKWIQGSALNAEEQIANQLNQQKFSLDKDKFALEEKKNRQEQDWKSEELKLKKQELSQKEKALLAKSNGGQSEGQKKVDQDYAKHYNNFTGKGRANALQTIKQLEELQAELDKESKNIFQSGGGRLTSMMPDMVRTTDSLRWKSEIPAKANLVLKELFGGQLSDGERESESKTYYNDLLSPADNSRVLSKKIQTLKDQLTSETAKARFFRDKGTLNNFNFEDTQLSSQEAPANTSTPAAPQVFSGSQIDWK